MTAAVAVAMNEFQRMTPLPAGVSPISPSGLRGIGGLRYILWPTVATCTFGSCVAPFRTLANDAMLFYNAWLSRLERDTGIPRDRVDWGSLLEANTVSFGGQSCWSGHRVAGSSFDADVSGGGWAASVVTHEIAHCMGLVRSSSPNWNGGSHSRNQPIPTNPGLPMVHMLTRIDIGNPVTVMFPTVAAVRRSILEGWEWNDFHRALLSMDRPETDPSGADAPETGHVGDEPMFHLVGLIDRSDDLKLLYSQRIDNLPLDLIPEAPNSPYKILISDANGATLEERHFAPPIFEGADGKFESVGISLTTRLPAGSKKAEITKSGQMLHSVVFSDKPPAIQSIELQEDQQDSVSLKWIGSDPDTQKLRYNIYFQPGADSIPLLVQAGLTTPGYSFRTDLAPATSDARLIVEATDGFHTAQASSREFEIPAKPPAVAVIPPSQPFAGGTLVGAAYDFTAGALRGQALSWESNLDGSLGFGERLEVVLSEGIHRITLTATAPSGLSSSTTTEVAVLASSR